VRLSPSRSASPRRVVARCGSARRGSRAARARARRHPRRAP
jgi:hypothetical protein